MAKRLKKRDKSASFKPKNRVKLSTNDIAIVGMSCRFPDANNYQQFWENLLNSKNSIREITPDRWDIEEFYSPDQNEPGKSISKWAGLIDNIDTFDASFFNISPREAQTMDPQQRLLLEETWHCIEDSGVTIKDLREGNSSVYVGVMAIDYGQHISADNKSTNAYACLGNYEGILANRLSYFFNLHGESKSIDAACASSLVAVHDAKKSLLSGKSKYAIAAGVNVICHPWKYISFSKAHMLSPDGQCKTFDADANGYVPGEGVGVLLLETLENAIKNGHRVYAVLKGSAVHHSGKTQSITAPRVESERDVIKEAIDESGVTAEGITYLEAHGTGTSLGDPIEIEASRLAFNTDKKQYCSIGSVKTNVGHLEAAAGVAGIIKVILMMQHKKIPKTLNVQTVNPIIDFSRTPFRLANKLTNWELPNDVDKRRASISSFGFGGVIANAVIEEYNPTTLEKKSTPLSQSLPFTFSARSKQSLVNLLNQYTQSDVLKSYSLEDISYTLTQARAHFDYRFGVAVKSKEALLDAIKEFLANPPEMQIDNKNSFSVYLNEGKKFDYDMFRKLSQHYPVLKQIDSETIKTFKYDEKFKDLVTKYILVQALNLPITSIKGDGLLAAIVSGMLDLKSAAKFISNEYTSVNLSRPKIILESKRLEKIIRPYRIPIVYCEELVSHLMIDAASIDVLLKKSRLLIKSQFTFKKYLEEWQTALKKFNLDIYDAVDHFETIDAKQKKLVSIILLICIKKLNYKWQLPNTIAIDNPNVLEMIDLVLDGVLSEENLVKLFFDTSDIPSIIEKNQAQLDPKKPYSLLKKFNQDVPEIADVKTWLDNAKGNTLTIGHDEQSAIALNLDAMPSVLIHLWLMGANIDWAQWFPKGKRNTVILPGYVFEKTRYWNEANNTENRIHSQLHPLIDANNSTIDKTSYTKLLTGKEFYLHDHRLRNIPIMPAVAYLEMARAAASLAMPSEKVITLRHIIWSRPIFIRDKPVQITLSLFPKPLDTLFEVTSDNEKLKPNIHIQGKIYHSIKDNSNDSLFVDIKTIQDRCQKITNGTVLYQKFMSRGVQCGPALQVIDEIAYNDNELIAKLHLPKQLQKTAGEFVLHPSIMDGALETIFEILKQDNSVLYLPFGIDELTIYGRFNQAGYVHATSVTGTTTSGIEKFNIEITDEVGKVLVSVKNFSLRTLEAIDIAENVKTYAYHPEWKKSDRPTAESKQSMIVIDNGTELSDIKEIPSTIIYKMQLNPNNLIEDNLKESIYKMFALMQMLIHKRLQKPLQIICVNVSDHSNAIFIEALSGFAKAVKMENPNITLRIITIDDDKNLQAIIAKELETHELVIRYDNGNRLVKHYIENVPQKNALTTPLKKNGVYLITGGAGGLGLIFARYLVTHYQAQLILTGRSELQEKQRSILSELGSNVFYHKADITKQDDVKNLIQSIKQKFGDLNGIFHSAGVIRDAFILKKTMTEMEQVIAPKVYGTIYLDEFTKGESLDFFILFSSMVSVLGNVGQSDYAYANSFMDHFAEYREELRNKGQRLGKTLTINWPLWAQGGMQINEASKLWLNKTFGVVPLSTEEGIQALLDSFNQPYYQQIILPGNKSVIDKNFTPASQQLASIEVSTSPVSELNQEVEKKLISTVADLLNIPIENINPSDDVTKFGMDSISITELAIKLSDFYSIELSPTILYEYHTLQSFAGYLLKQYPTQLNTTHSNAPISTAPEKENVLDQSNLKPLKSFSESKSIHDEKDFDIAIIGMHGVFPQSKDLDHFWNHLKAGDDLISEIPQERWDWRDSVDSTATNKPIYKWGGFINDVDMFDADFFNISPREAELMDPQQRLFLETAWKAIEDSGYDPQALSGKKVGVFVGVEFDEYQELVRAKENVMQGYTLTGNSHAILANRVSYLLNIHGPSEAIDTGSSSALVALHRAITSLQLGESTLAIAGGVNLMFSSARFNALGKLGVLSQDGHCKTFDKSANGYVRAEGVGAILLKPLSQALLDGDMIYGIIRGSGVNHGGKAQSLTAPNSAAQAELIEHIYKKNNIDPSRITYIEAHGTGTALGDPIEIDGLKSAFSKFHTTSSKSNYCGLGSVKTNIGHLEPAAGIAGVIKVLLSLKHGELPGTVHYKELNPYIKIDSSPFYIVAKTKEWNRIKDDAGNEIPRLAAVSSFGFGGVNAHVVIEEAQKPHTNSIPKPSHLITLSAKTDNSLRLKILDLLSWIKKQKTVTTLEQVAYILNTGRSQYEKRCAIVVSSLDELDSTLQVLVDGTTPSNAFVNYLKVINNNNIDEEAYEVLQKSPEPVAYRSQLLSFANLYVEGSNVDWQKFYKDQTITKISLPTYPFEKKRFWIEDVKKAIEKTETVSINNMRYYYTTNWLEKNSDSTLASTKLSETVILFGDDSQLTDKLSATLTKDDRHIIQIKHGQNFKKIDKYNYTINKNAAADYEQVFSGLIDDNLSIQNILLATSQDALKASMLDLFYLAKALIKFSTSNASRLTVVALTENSFGLSFVEALSSSLKTIHIEQPKITTKLINFSDAANITEATLLSELFNNDLYVTYISNRKRLVKVTTEVFDAKQSTSVLKEKGTYLITGGTGGLGLIFARYLATQYHANLILLGRSSQNQKITSHIDELKKLGSDVLYVNAEVSDETSLKNAIATAINRFGTFNGVIHAAGITRDAIIAKKTPQEISAVLLAKVNGTILLDELTKDIPLDFFICFSSVASIFGNIGQFDYAFANGFMDGYTKYRGDLQTQGLRHGKSISINWPLWAEGGMQIDEISKQWMTQSFGAVPLSTKDGIAAFISALGNDEKQRIVLVGNKNILDEKLGMRDTNVIREIPATQVNYVQIDELVKQVQHEVTNRVSKIVKINDINIEEDISKYALDSINLTELSLELNEFYGLQITPAIFYEHSTLKSFIEQLIKNDSAKLALKHATTISTVPPIPADKTDTKMVPKEIIPASHDQSIAIIGMSSIFPGANNTTQFWDNLINKRDSISEIPKDRWDWQACYGDGDRQTKAKYGGFTDTMYDFDTSFFHISPHEAKMMDPQHRLFLRATWEAIEDAGYTKDNLEKENVGVYVGVTNNDYAEILQQHNETSAHVATGITHSVLANRISYFFNLSGPSQAIDTACSSSLVALHQALTAIQNHDCNVAIVGGVNAVLTPSIYLELTQAGALSEDGRCKTFDKTANGYVRAEGAGVVIIKPLQKALADGDFIYGVIKGSAINHGGHVSSLTVPNPNAQAEVIKTAMMRSSLGIDTISYIETHGTGTPIGDPIEINGLKKAFKELSESQNCTVKNSNCLLGAVKTNIGHLEPAAGIAGLIKTLLAMHYKKIPGTVHFQQLNPYINLSDTPFHIAIDTQEWIPLKDKNNNPISLRAGISSFGFGGANAHVVVEEGPKFPIESDKQSDYLFILSAHTEVALHQKISDLYQWLNAKTISEVSLKNLSFTLNQCRAHFQYRIAFIAPTVADLKDLLNQVLKNEHAKNYINALVHAQKVSDTELISLAKKYVQGEKINWSQIYTESNYRKLPFLPTYPFEKVKHALPYRHNGAESLPARDLSCALIDKVVSNTNPACYLKSFSGKEFYFYDHKVRHTPTLPGVAYIEMVRAAAERYSQNQSIVSINNLIWVTPIQILDKNVDVNINIKTENNITSFEVVSISANQLTVHAQGNIVYSSQVPIGSTIDLIDLKRRFVTKLTLDDFYHRCEALGLGYGKKFQVIKEVSRNSKEIFARLNLTDISNEFILHPSLMDGALQTTILLLNPNMEPDKLYLPFSIGEIRFYGMLPATCYVHVTLDNSTSSTVRKMQIQIMDENGNLLVSFKDFTARLYHSKTSDDVHYYLPTWQTHEITSISPVQKKNRVLFIGNNPAVATELASYFDKANFLKVVDLQNESKGVDFTPDTIIILTELPVNGAAKNNIESSLQKTLYRFINLAKVLMSMSLKQPINIIWCNHNNTPDLSLFTESLSGIARTLKLEHPKMNTRLIEVNNNLSLAKTIINEVDQNELIVSYDAAGIRKVKTYELLPLLAAHKPSILKKQGTYLITGGLGGLGKIFARYLAKTYQAKLILLGRSTTTSTQQTFIDELVSYGSEVSYLSVDITNEVNLKSILEQAKSRFTSINGVLHCAGVLHDSFIFKKTDDAMIKVTAPKINGTINLDQLTKDEPLDFFVMFSSLAAIIGNLGQGDYAYANGFMDMYAQHRDKLRMLKQRNGQSISINWPLWAEGGMQVDQATLDWMANDMGTTPLGTDAGIKAFLDALDNNLKQLIVVAGDKNKLNRTINPILEKSQPLKTEPLQTTHIESSNLFPQVQDFLKNIIAAAVDIKPEEIGSDTAFESFGIDSLMIIKLNKSLDQEFKDLPKTLFFEYTTLNELTNYFIENYTSVFSEKFKLKEETKVTTISEPTHAAKSIDPSPVNNKGQMAKEDIAIIGISGRYPDANNIDEFWENLKKGRDSIKEIPSDRWDLTKYFDADKNKKGKVYSKWGAFIDDVDKFDPMFFNISPREAELTDPQERLFLEESYKTLEDAGYTKDQLKGKNVGVYVGVMYKEYKFFGVEETQNGNVLSTGQTPASIANRVSYFFDFHGPSMTLDTMCSSSLTAIHLACQSILTGECDYVIAGGVNLTIHPSKYIELAQGKFLASDGHCKSFGEGGDGYVPGEGVGAVLLKPLSKALQDGDHIYGIIKATHVNHGGKTHGYTVPNPIAQAELVKNGLTQSNIDPSTLSYIEAHGTGTSLGDPIEINGLVRAIGSHLTTPVAIGSVKSNIGHLESAAGIAALTKVILQLNHKQIVPSLFSDTLNPNIDWAHIPFRVQQKLQDWNTSTYPRRSLISSFGAGGSNAMIVVEEAPSVTSQPATDQDAYLIPLSAKNDEALKQKLMDLSNWLKKSEKLTLSQIAYTLSVGRSHFEKMRCAFVVSSLQELKESLLAYNEGKKLGNVFITQEKNTKYQAIFKETAKYIQKEIEESPSNINIKEKLLVLAHLYTEGVNLNWDSLYKIKYQKVPLPTYPFAKERYWIPQPDFNTNPVSLNTSLHPLIDNNISTLDGISFQKKLNSGEFYLKDHHVNGIPTLPGVAYLEMVRAATHLALPNQKIIGLRNVIWAIPVQMKESTKDVTVNLKKEKDDVSFEIATQDQMHAAGKIIVSDSTKQNSERIDIKSIESRCNKQINIQDFYDDFEKIGLHYGPSFQVVKEISYNENELFAKIAISGNDNRFVLHPAMMDGSLQTLAALVSSADGKLYLPFSIGEVNIYNAIPSTCFVYATRTSEISSEVQKFKIYLLDQNHNILVKLSDFSLRASTGASKQQKVYHYRPIYTEAPVKQAVSSDKSLLIISKNDQLYGKLTAHSQNQIQFAKTVDTLEDFNSLLEQFSSHDIPNIIVHDTGVFDSTVGSLDAYMKQNMHALLYLCKAIIKLKMTSKVKLICIARSKLVANAIVGFNKTLLLEQPNMRSAMLCIEGNEQHLAEILMNEIDNDATEIYYQDGMKRLIRSYDEIDNKTLNSDLPFKKNGVYLITGGMGGLGLIFAKDIAKNYGSKLILLGRSELSDKQKTILDALKNLGSEAIYVQSDISNEESVKKTISTIKDTYGNLNGIIHSAGILKDEFILKKTKEQVDAIIAPKISGTVFLDAATQTEPLDFFVLFSSVASVISVMGQCDYAYANGFMDAFAEFRENLRINQKRQGLTVAINWPLWAEGGMHMDTTSEKAMEQKLGLIPLKTEEGLKSFKLALSQHSPQMIVLAGNKSKFIHLLKSTKNEEIIQPAETVEHCSSDATIEEYLRSLLAETAKLPKEKVDPNEPFESYGIDSVMIMAMNQTLEQKFGDLPKTLFFEYPDLKSLSNYLTETYSTRQKVDSDKAENGDVTSYLKAMISEVLKLPINKIDENESFENYGIDSVMIMSMNQMLEKRFGNLSKTLFFEYTTISSLANYLMENTVTKPTPSPEKELNDIKKSLNAAKGQNQIIENYKKMFINYDQLNINIMPSSFGVDMEVFDVGQGDVILLLPPWGCISTAWRNQLETLSKHYRVISVHFPGCGRSEFNAAFLEYEKLSALIMDILNRMKVKTPIHLVGWSGGGIIAQYILNNYPAQIKSMTLVNSTNKLNMLNAKSVKNVEDIMKIFKNDFNISRNETGSQFVIEQINGITDLNVLQEYWFRDISFNANSLSTKIEVPVLLINGGKDLVMPENDSTAWQNKVKMMESYVLPSAGHYIPLFYAEYFNKKLLAFLEKVKEYTIQR